MTALPILLAIVGAWAAPADRDWVTWTAIGGLWGFVVIGAWSIGPFFLPAAILLLLSGVARADARRNWRNLVLVPIWIAQGAATIAILLFGLAVARGVFGSGPRFLG